MKYSLTPIYFNDILIFLNDIKLWYKTWIQIPLNNECILCVCIYIYTPGMCVLSLFECV